MCTSMQTLNLTHIVRFQFPEDLACLQSPETHKHCDLVEEPLLDFFRLNCGVNCNSSLNSFTHYHVCDVELPCDVIHNVLVQDRAVPYIHGYVANYARLTKTMQ